MYKEFEDHDSQINVSNKLRLKLNAVISRQSDVPIEKQISEQIKNAIISGELVEDTLLPHHGRFAGDLRVSPGTVMDAYDDLERKGFIAKAHGRHYVRPRNPELPRRDISIKRESKLNIVISRLADAPIYKQISKQIKDAIIGGEFAERELLPPIGRLARNLKVPTLAVACAYNDLEKEGFAVNIRGRENRGRKCYVRLQNPDLMRKNKLSEIKISLFAAITDAKLIKLSKKELTEIWTLLLENVTENCGQENTGFREVCDQPKPVRKGIYYV